MYTQEITVNNEVGLHARPATFFIQKANEFKSGIWVEKEDRRVNAKSLLGVLSLGIVKGTKITLIADGSDEEDAVKALVELVEDNFGEYTDVETVSAVLSYDRAASFFFSHCAPAADMVQSSHQIRERRWRGRDYGKTKRWVMYCIIPGHLRTVHALLAV